jgi:hypothetical protein
VILEVLSTLADLYYGKKSKVKLETMFFLLIQLRPFCKKTTILVKKKGKIFTKY